MSTNATTVAGTVNNQFIARQPGVGGNVRRQIAPQRLVPTKNLQPINGNSLQTARTSAQANGFSVPAGSPFWTNGVINVALINGKSSVVSLAPGVDTLQLADQIFNARGLSSSDRKKELIPGFTVAQYLAWRDAAIAFNREEPGIGTNRRGLELVKTAELFERKLMNSLNAVAFDITPPGIQYEQAKRQEIERARIVAETAKRREGRDCKLATNFRFSTTDAGNTAAAFATFAQATKNGRIESTAVVKAEQRVTPSAPFSTSGSAQRRGTVTSSETGDGSANTAIGITVQGGTVATASHQFRAVCTWADGQQITATPANGNPAPPTNVGGWYSETRRFFGL